MKGVSVELQTGVQFYIFIATIPTEEHTCTCMLKSVHENNKTNVMMVKW